MKKLKGGKIKRKRGELKVLKMKKKEVEGKIGGENGVSNEERKRREEVRREKT